MQSFSEIIETDKKFKEAIGAFVIAFSKVEYGLAVIAALSEYDLRKSNEAFLEWIGQTLENKLKRISGYIKSETPELEKTWEFIRNEIGLLNQERRHIVHGIHHWTLPKGSIRSRVKKGKELKEKHHTLSDIKDLTNRLAIIATGKNGINGEFYNKFFKFRVENWNKLVAENHKISY